MKKTMCPSCGAPYNGKRCRSCGYEPFLNEPHPQKAPSANRRKCRKKHPLLGFLILLALIWAMLPLLRNWGKKLESIEQRNQPAVSATEFIPPSDS